MQKVYFISGLGADRRVFSFLDLSFCEPVFIDWITPIQNETLTEYAHRLRESIPEKDPVIVGLSLGGMLAGEMAKTNEKIKAIIISSNRTSKELPYYLRVFRYFPFYKWIPGTVLMHMKRVDAFVFGVKDKKQKELLYQIINDANTRFVKWAIGAILNWESTAATDNIIHIHGTADKLLHIRYVNPDHTIPGGTHIMTFDKHHEVSAILKKLVVG